MVEINWDKMYFSQKRKAIKITCFFCVVNTPFLVYSNLHSCQTDTLRLTKVLNLVAKFIALVCICRIRFYSSVHVCVCVYHTGVSLGARGRVDTNPSSTTVQVAACMAS